MTDDVDPFLEDDAAYVMGALSPDGPTRLRGAPRRAARGAPRRSPSCPA